MLAGNKLVAGAGRPATYADMAVDGGGAGRMRCWRILRAAWCEEAGSDAQRAGRQLSAPAWRDGVPWRGRARRPLQKADLNCSPLLGRRNDAEAGLCKRQSIEKRHVRGRIS